MFIHILKTVGVIFALIVAGNLAVFGPLVWRSYRDGDFR